MNKETILPDSPVENERIFIPFNGSDRIFAVLSFIIAYFYICAPLNGITHALCGIGSAVISIIYLIANKRPFNLGYVMIALGGFMSFGLFLNGLNSFVIHFMLNLFILACICYGNFLSWGGGATKLGYGSFYDVATSCISVPFSRYGDVFPALFHRSGIHGTKNSKKGLYVFIGLCIALVPTLIVIILLTTADAAFSGLMDKIFSIEIPNLFEFIMKFILCVPVAMYIFGRFSAGKRRVNIGRVKSKQAKKFIPHVLSCAMIFPLLIVYVLFFVSQSAYHFSAFAGILPQNYSYAEYAREGFFQLCAVAFINLAFLIIITSFTKRNDSGKEYVWIKISKVLLSLFTVGFSVISIQKMFLYIGQYGLTQKRIMTSWFMIILGFIFICSAIRTLASSFPLEKVVTFFVAIMLFIVSFVSLDSRIVSYNLDASEKGKIEEFNTACLSEIGSAAVPLVYDLKDSEDDRISQDVTDFILEQINRLKTTDKHEWTIHDFKAFDLFLNLREQ